ncbi:hypothetical protein C8039_01655 [Halogeometricum sp. wsp3]|nr:hypothetical protein C8039_01655 [Halogeometricum sp. wsp3]
MGARPTRSWTRISHRSTIFWKRRRRRLSRRRYESHTQKYLSGFDAPTRSSRCTTRDTRSALPAELEFGRAKRESRAETVERYVDFDHQSNVEEYGH